MIAKHVPMRTAQKSDFSDLVSYITNSQDKEHRLGQVAITNCSTDNLQAATAEILATQYANKRSKNDKTYHLIISFPAGEEPPNNVLAELEERICSGLGFGEHQRISAVHNDTDNLHIHIAINKIHPETNTILEPYRAYKTLGELCESLENEYGLERVNHNTKRSLSEGRAGDMEAHADVESLVSWIRKECLSDIRAAESWSDLHKIMDEHGLVIRPQGAGLVIDSGGVFVKASTVSREISKNSLEKRLGAFDGSCGSGSVVKKLYSKQPIKRKVNTTELYAQYKNEQKNLSTKRSTALEKLRKKKTKEIEFAKKANRLKRLSIKLLKGEGVNKKLLYSQVFKSYKKSLNAASAEFKKEKDKLYASHKNLAWADWLKAKSENGNEKALEVLRAKQRKANYKGCSISSTNVVNKNHKVDLAVDSVTKEGSVIYRAGTDSIRDTGKELRVSNVASDATIHTALKIAVDKYGACLKINGSPEFKAKLIDVSVKSNLSIKFADPVLENIRIKRIKERELNSDRQDRRRIDSGSTGVDRSGRSNSNGSGGGSRKSGGYSKPNIARVGRKPPPEGKNRLRRLSQLGVVQFEDRSEMLLPGNVSRNVEQQRPERDNELRRSVSGGGIEYGSVHLRAVHKYIEERENKRKQGFDIPKHVMYNNLDSGGLTFAGIRKVEDFYMALVKSSNGEVGVIAVDSRTANRLRILSIGDSVYLTTKGTIRKKGRSR